MTITTISSQYTHKESLQRFDALTFVETIVDYSGLNCESRSVPSRFRAVSRVPRSSYADVTCTMMTLKYIVKASDYCLGNETRFSSPSL